MVLDAVEVVKYEDYDLEPPFIGPDNFFYRHTFRPKTKRITVSLLYWSTMCFVDGYPVQPFSRQEVCSICQQPYNPDAAQQSPESFTMHFCPRDTCQTACHRQCLSTHTTRKRPTCTDRNLSLLCSIPSVFLEPSASSSASTPPPSLLSLLSKSKSKPAPQSRSQTRKRKRVSEVDAQSLFEDLPPDLVELASQPIVKPTFEPSSVRERPSKTRSKGRKTAPKLENIVYNVAGNITMVLKARVLISGVLQGATILPRDWKRKIGLDDKTAPSLIVDGEDSPCPPLLCPTCGEHI